MDCMATKAVVGNNETEPQVKHQNIYNIKYRTKTGTLREITASQRPRIRRPHFEHSPETIAAKKVTPTVQLIESKPNGSKPETIKRRPLRNLKLDRVPARILILGLRPIFDVIHGLPMLCALREQFGSSRIAWLTSPEGADFLENHWTGVEIITAQKSGNLLPWNLLRQRAIVRDFAPTLVIDLSDTLHTRLLTAGGGKQRFAPHRSMQNDEENEVVHYIDLRLEFLRELGIPADKPRFDLPLHLSCSKKIAEQLAELGIKQEFIVMAPQSESAMRQWKPERFAAVVRYLGSEYGIRTVLLSHNRLTADVPEKKIAEASRGFASILPMTSPLETLELMRLARFCIGNDCEPLHLAVAAGTPCIGIYGQLGKDHNLPYGDRHKVVRPRFAESAPEQWPDYAKEQQRWIDSISYGDVCAMCDELLEEAETVQLKFQTEKPAVRRVA